MSNGISGLALLMQERDNILQTELGVLLHNLGKLSKAFLAYQRCKACEKLKKTPNPNDYIYEKFKYQAIVGLVAEFVTSPGVSLGPQDWQRLESSAEDWLDEPTNNFLPETLRKFLQQRIICFPEPLE